MASNRSGDRAKWLDQVKEPVLEPDRQICDPHHHLWDYPNSRYELDELGADTRGGAGCGVAVSAASPASGHNVESTVFVECSSEYVQDGPESLRPAGETRYVVALAEESAKRDDVATIQGIVGFADLTLGDGVSTVIEAHLEAASSTQDGVEERLFKGIRHAAGWHGAPEIKNSHTSPPKHLLLDSMFRRGFAQLAKYSLSFDAWLYHPQIPELTDLARAFPQTAIVLDHLGGPLGIGPFEGKRDEVFAEWQRDIAELATCGNVSLKFGGMLMPINGWGFHRQPTPPGSQRVKDVLRPWFDVCLECFGPRRIMFESNFPVDKLSVSYGVLWNALKRLAQELSQEDKGHLFRANARRFYRLSLMEGAR